MERGGSLGGQESLADAFDEISRFTLRNVADRGEIGITAMSALGRLDQDGPVRLTALAAAEGISQPSMTQLVQRLERQQLLTRVDDPEDGRASLIAIADAGRALRAELRRNRHERLAELISTVSEEDQASLALAMHVAQLIVRRLTETASQLPASQQAVTPL